MARSNTEVAGLLDEIGDLLELDNANPFRVRAYRRAAQTIRGLDTKGQTVHDVELTKLGGIGADLAGKITELANIGTTQVLDEARESWPEGVRALLKVDGLGPKRVKLLHVELGVQSVADLQRAVDTGILRSVKGLGESLEKKLKVTLAAPVVVRPGDGRFPIAEVTPIAKDFVTRVLDLPGVKRAEAAGSYRRGKATVGDLDIVVCADAKTKWHTIIDAFVKFPGVAAVLAQGDTKGAVKLHNGLQVDMRVVDEDSYGAALLYFTGSKQHSIELRQAAIKLGLKVNEYGVYRGDERIAGKTEKDMYDALGMKFLTPAERER